MNQLKEHKYMDAFTTLGYITFIFIAVVMLITQNYVLLVVGVVAIISVRLIGYSIDRIIEAKK